MFTKIFKHPITWQLAQLTKNLNRMEESKNIEQTRKSSIQLVVRRFCNFLYWFIHNEIATTILMIFLIIFGFALAPFYIVGNYFYRYYCRINGL